MEERLWWSATDGHTFNQATSKHSVTHQNVNTKGFTCIIHSRIHTPNTDTIPHPIHTHSDHYRMDLYSIVQSHTPTVTCTAAQSVPCWVWYSVFVWQHLSCLISADFEKSAKWQAASSDLHHSHKKMKTWMKLNCGELFLTIKWSLLGCVLQFLVLHLNLK